MYGILYICECQNGEEYESFVEFKNKADFDEQVCALKILSKLDEDDLFYEQKEDSEAWDTVAGWMRYEERVVSIRYHLYKVERIND